MDDLILPPSSLKSPVWAHFKLTRDKKQSSCILCNTRMPYNGNTTNMRTHMERHHPTVPVTVVRRKTPSATSVKVETELSVLTVPHMFSAKHYYPNGSLKAQAITKSLASYIAMDMRPFSIVENEGFRNFVKTIDPKYKLPNRKTLSKSTIPLLYEETKLVVKSDVSSADKLALTTDGWTSRATEGYITITSHHINEQWELKSYVLQTRIIEESHTGVNIGKVLKDAVEEWHLKDRHPALVTDNASNMTIAAEAAEMHPHVPCFAHTLNLATQRGMKVPKVNTMLARVRKIVSFFHRSTVAFALLKKNQSCLGLPKGKLKIDVQTRWNSTFDMLERFLVLQPAIYATLVSKDIKKSEKEISTLSEDDVKNMEVLVEFLQPLKRATEVLCEEKTPTISVVAPMLNLLKNHVEIHEEDSLLIREVKAAMNADLAKRYQKTSEKDTLLHSSALDPRFKSLPFLSQEERAAVFGSLASNVTEYYDTNKPQVCVKTEAVPRTHTVTEESDPALPSLPSLHDHTEDMNLPKKESDNHGTSGQSSIPSTSQPDVSQPTPAKKANLTRLFGDVYVVKVELGTAQKKPMSSFALSQAEIQKYIEEDPLPVDGNPLLWWKYHEVSYPMLSYYAKSILCIPGTSVPSERVFSTAGDIVTAQRANLQWKYVDMMIFLKKNMKI